MDKRRTIARINAKIKKEKQLFLPLRNLSR